MCCGWTGKRRFRTGGTGNSQTTAFGLSWRDALPAIAATTDRSLEVRSPPMNVTFSCPHCQQSARVDVLPADSSLVCPECGTHIAIPAGAQDGLSLGRCLVCPSTDLYVRKDFPQRLGVALVAVGIVGSSIAWGYALPILTFAVLLATALLDVVLYLIVPNALMCYRCGAQYRGVSEMETHGGFNLETHERYRQQAARLKRPVAADAPHSSR